MLVAVGLIYYIISYILFQTIYNIIISSIESTIEVLQKAFRLSIVLSNISIIAKFEAKRELDD